MCGGAAVSVAELCQPGPEGVSIAQETQLQLCWEAGGLCSEVTHGAWETQRVNFRKREGPWPPQAGQRQFEHLRF